MQNENRNSTIDIMKAIGIILMVYGHCGGVGKHFIYLFHMPLFFVLSGYCWKDDNARSKNSVFRYIKRKWASLWIPFVVCNSIFLLLHNFFVEINISTEKLTIKEIGVGLIRTVCFIGGVKA